MPIEKYSNNKYSFSKCALIAMREMRLGADGECLSQKKLDGVFVEVQVQDVFLLGDINRVKSN